MARKSLLHSQFEAIPREDALQFCETFSLHDYTVMLDMLYGMFAKEEAEKTRIFDPFVGE